MMDGPLDELYFRWLYSQVGNPKLKNPSRTYWALLRQLYTKEFIWLIPNDDNRLEDGLDLRYEFVEKEGLHDVDQHWMGMGCSMLEMLIALSRRLSFEDDGPAEDWFWQLLENIGLRYCNDKSDFLPQDVDDILDEVIWRTYNPDGSGGLFPLMNANEDQREVELWYQLSAYLLEHNTV
jgi:hypothetical protein